MRRMPTLFRLAALALLATPATAASVLKPWDAQLYAAAFDATREGAFDEAQDYLGKVSDTTLNGYVLAQQYLHPQSNPSYEALVGWLQTYGDHPQATRVHALALRKRPADAPPPPAPAAALRYEALSADTDVITPEERAFESRNLRAPQAFEAERLFYENNDKAAYQIAAAARHHWIAGLAAYRMNDYGAARRHFEILAMDGSTDAWTRSGAAFWAARAAIALGDARVAPDFLRLAARWPLTFYGLIAERQLGLDPGSGASAAPAAMSTGEFERLARAFPQARRAAALVQLDRHSDAVIELRGALGVANAADKPTLQALATSLGLSGFGARAGSAATMAEVAKRYPIPSYRPDGGFTIDPALVYALCRQESNFNPGAVSGAGARGLMQLMPRTAAWLAGNPNLDLNRLHDPSFNMRLGQVYIRHLMDTARPRGDLIRAVASYNGGPGAFSKWSARMADATDALLVIESLPSRETRDFVEKVVSNYWIYRQRLGQQSPTLDAVVSGTPSIFVEMDANPSRPVRMSAQ